MKRLLMMSGILALLAFGIACGGSSDDGIVVPPPIEEAENVAPVLVDGGPPVLVNGELRQVYANGIFATVTICEPGSNNCQRLDNMLVDTGSYGVRVFSSQIPTLVLPFEASSTGSPLAACALFVDSAMWGPVGLADVLIAGEEANGIPIHIVGEPSFPVPSECADRTTMLLTEPGFDFPPDGILGIGNFREDCGPACALPAEDLHNPWLYYDCPESGCTPTSAELIQQIQNPVSAFSVDNNGVILDLPRLPNHVATSATGSLIFGIGTRSNNALSGVTVFPLDDAANLETIYNNTSHIAFMDSGSNALFFGTPTGSMPECRDEQGFLTGLYCPALGKNLTATVVGATEGSPSETIGFTILNANTLFANPANFVFDNLGGPNPPASSEDIPVFDWGLPFFFGRSVYYSMEGANTPAGNMLYVAF